MALTHSPRIVRDGLVLHLDAANVKSYPGSGSTWKDLSGQGNDGTLYGSPSFNSYNNGSFNFDESNDYVNCGLNGVFNKNSYTKIAWFRPESTTYNLISGGNDAGAGDYGEHAFWLNGTSTTVTAGHNNNWTTVSYNAGDMLNQWWCAAVTFNSSSGWVLYLNGEIVDTDASTTVHTGNTGILIGAYTPASNLFDGDIAIAQVYSKTLSASEIQQNFNATRDRYGI